MRWCHVGRREVLAGLALVGVSCSADPIDPPVPAVDAAYAEAATADIGDSPYVDAARADAGAPDAGAPDAGAVDTAHEDDAVVVQATFPDQLRCGQVATATVVVRNTGTATWTRAAGYKLGGIGDSDPLHPGEARVWLPDGAAVPPGGSYSFDVALVGPPAPGAYTARWRMVHELVRWFGASASHAIAVDCPAAVDAGVLDAGAPDAGVPVTLDLAHATVLNSPPDVASWPATARITRLDLGLDGVHVDFTKRDGPGSWPDVPFGAPGDSLEYTIWMVENVGGQVYTSGGIQFWRGLDRNGGPPSGYAMNWYYDPNRWRPMTGHQPAVGEPVGFFVTAGNARNVTDHSGSTVMERSDVVVVPFPADPGAVFTF